MVAVQVVAVTAVAVPSGGLRRWHGPGVSLRPAGGGHFMPLSLTSRAAPQARQSAPMASSRVPAGPVLRASDRRIGRLVAVDTAGRLWAWAGTSWKPRTSGGGPREGAAAVYDPALGDLVVFGTVTSTGAPTRQTWLWNGTRWIIGP